MKDFMLSITQEVKNEIDRNIRLRLKLGEQIKTCNADYGINSGHLRLSVVIKKDDNTATENIEKLTDGDMELRESLLEIIKSPKEKKKGIPNLTESERKYWETMRNEFKSNKYSFDDLNCYISRIRRNSLIVGVICSLNDENEDCFSDDSDELKTVIKSVYSEFEHMSDKEKKKLFAAAKDKYILYIYDRADFLTSVQNALNGY